MKYEERENRAIIMTLPFLFIAIANLLSTLLALIENKEVLALTEGGTRNATT
jgi:hypothetical protein